MTLRSILVATDLSAQENGALQRAAQLARAHRAAVKLVYLPPAGERAPAHAASRLANAALRLHESLDLRVKAAPLKAGRPEDLARAARGMDLLVLPHRHERSTAAFFRGQPVLRLLRQCCCPVLVTRQRGGAPYRRILVAVEFARDSDALARLAARLDDSAELEVFLADRGAADAGLQAVARQQCSGAELVVLAKRHSCAWEDFVCGSAAQRVLGCGTSDVLLVPQGALESRASGAARRSRRRGSEAGARVQAAARRPLHAT